MSLGGRGATPSVRPLLAVQLSRAASQGSAASFAPSPTAAPGALLQSREQSLHVKCDHSQSPHLLLNRVALTGHHSKAFNNSFLLASSLGLHATRTYSFLTTPELGAFLDTSWCATSAAAAPVFPKMNCCTVSAQATFACKSFFLPHALNKTQINYHVQGCTENRRADLVRGKRNVHVRLVSPPALCYRMFWPS